MAPSRYSSSRRPGRESPNVMSEMFQKTPGWVWIVVLIVLVLLWKFVGK